MEDFSNWIITDKEASKYQVSYGKYIRNISQNFWSGHFSRTDFIDTMKDVINPGLTKAFKEGMQSVGIDWEEVTDEEKDTLNQWIANELNYLAGYADFIEKNSKANGGKFETLSNRIRLWAGRYLDIVNRARLLAKNDPKLKWIINPEKEHCESCLKLKDKVKRKSYWNKMGLRPKSEKLDCSLGCGCDLVPTDEPITKGRLPNI